MDVFLSYYVEVVGKSYMQALMNVIYLSSDMEIVDNELTKKSIRRIIKSKK